MTFLRRFSIVTLLVVLACSAVVAQGISVAVLGGTYLSGGNDARSEDYGAPLLQAFVKIPLAQVEGLSLQLQALGGEAGKLPCVPPAELLDLGCTHSTGRTTAGLVGLALELELGLAVFEPTVSAGYRFISEGSSDESEMTIFPVEASNHPFVALGANAYLPLIAGRFGILGQFRWSQFTIGEQIFSELGSRKFRDIGSVSSFSAMAGVYIGI